MSRTFKDKPQWIKIRENSIVEHDHSIGECDIDEFDIFLKEHGASYLRRVVYSSISKRALLHKNCPRKTIYYINCFHKISNVQCLDGFKTDGDKNYGLYYEKKQYISPKVHEIFIYSYLKEEFIKITDVEFTIPNCDKNEIIKDSLTIINGNDLKISNDGSYYSHFYNLFVIDENISCKNCNELKDYWDFNCTRPLEMSNIKRCHCFYCEYDFRESRESKNYSRVKLNNIKHYYNSNLDYSDVEDLL